jgi:hypothetical protein
MSEEELATLEDKYSTAIHQLNMLTNPKPQAPQPAHVEEMENTILVHEKNKTIRFMLDKSIENKPRSNWSRKRAKRYHATVKGMAREHIQELKAIRKVERKRERQRDRTATIVADSAATSTVIRNADAEHVDVLETKSQKVFQNANGTLYQALEMKLD